MTAVMRSICSIRPWTPPATDRDRRHDGHVQGCRQGGGIDAPAAPLGDVHHVERQDDRTAELPDLERQPEVQAQVGRVGHAHDDVGGGLVREPAEHDVARDLLVGAVRPQRIGARQIDHIDDAAARASEAAGLALDGDAGVVGDLLPAAGQRVEDRGLAAIRVADQGDAQDVGGKSQGGHRRVTLGPNASGRSAR
jgi:hypothetical protein